MNHFTQFGPNENFSKKVTSSFKCDINSYAKNYKKQSNGSKYIAIEKLSDLIGWELLSINHEKQNFPRVYSRKLDNNHFTLISIKKTNDSICYTKVQKDT